MWTPPEQPGGGGDTPTRPRRRWLPWLLAVIALFVAAVAAVVVMLLRIQLPAAHPLSQATLVYDASGHEVASFSEQNRVLVPLRQVPPVVVNAVVSTEDRHFFSEGAVNPLSMARALFDDIRGSGLQGGSTITQQYVKEAYLSPKRTLTRKIKEAVLAIRLSHQESKQQILQNYLNTIYWGRGAYGVEAASEAYFGKHVGQLGLPQASLLAALIREPELADPARNPALARHNQSETLKAMLRDRKITRAQASAVEALPFSRYVVPASASSLSGGPRVPGADYFIAAVRQELYAKYGRHLVDGGGLRVTTTLDGTAQAAAYNTVYGKGPGALNPAAGDPSAALVTIDGSGAVKALVGGQDYARSTVDLALGAGGGGSGRQAGSTFKAFMLAEVLNEGYSLYSTFPAPPHIVIPGGNANGAPWDVTNFAGESPAPSLNLIDATAMSVNTVFAQVVERIGAGKLDSMAEQLGIRPSELPHPYLSQVLGTADVSPLEMAAAYSTFADGGVYHRPMLITRVTRADGKPLPLPVGPQTRRVLTPKQAAAMDYVLQQVVQRGTGVAAGGLSTPVAGKTGTTEGSSDAWFIGYTPRVTTALWMGYASSARPMVDFRGLASVQGGTIPAQLWHTYMAALLSAFPQYAAPFPPADLSGGRILLPGPPPTPISPVTGIPTTTSTSSPSTTQPVATTRPQPVTTVAGPGGGPSTTVPAPTTTTATTAPPSPSTTVAGGGTGPTTTVP